MMLGLDTIFLTLDVPLKLINLRKICQERYFIAHSTARFTRDPRLLIDQLQNEVYHFFI
jgi:hypothetical protein